MWLLRQERKPGETWMTFVRHNGIGNKKQVVWKTMTRHCFADVMTMTTCSLENVSGKRRQVRLPFTLVFLLKYLHCVTRRSSRTSSLFILDPTATTLQCLIVKWPELYSDGFRCHYRFSKGITTKPCGNLEYSSNLMFLRCSFPIFQFRVLFIGFPENFPPGVHECYYFF